MGSPALPRQPGLAILSHLPSFLGAIIAAFAVYLIPRFVNIYRDLLGNEPLPPLTLFVLQLQPLWILFSAVFALAALCLVWRHRLRPVTSGVSFLLLFLASAQAVFILIALFQPLAGTIIREKPSETVDPVAK